MSGREELPLGVGVRHGARRDGERTTGAMRVENERNGTANDGHGERAA